MAGFVRDSNKITVAYNTDIESALNWTTGGLVFDSTPVREAVPELERQYDIEIRFADQRILNTTLTMSFERETLSQVLDVLALALDAQYRRDGRVITFTPVRGTRRPVPTRRSVPSVVTPEVKYGR
jgi:ferric-dicitrate binding protein FerR (iron transport regulator)